MVIATDSYRVNKNAIPPGLVARAMIDTFSLCRKVSLHFSRDIVPGGRQSCIVKARVMDVVRTLSMVAVWTFTRMEMKMVKYRGRVPNSYLQGYYLCFPVCGGGVSICRVK